jgi:hypothetical protein
MSGFWLLEYFEIGSTKPYSIEMVLSREDMEFAVALYLRLGGDDILRVTPAYSAPTASCIGRPT